MSVPLSERSLFQIKISLDSKQKNPKIKMIQGRMSSLFPSGKALKTNRTTKTNLETKLRRFLNTRTGFKFAGKNTYIWNICSISGQLQILFHMLILWFLNHSCFPIFVKGLPGILDCVLMYKQHSLNGCFFLWGAGWRSSSRKHEEEFASQKEEPWAEQWCLISFFTLLCSPKIYMLKS